MNQIDEDRAYLIMWLKVLAICVIFFVLLIYGLPWTKWNTHLQNDRDKYYAQLEKEQAFESLGSGVYLWVAKRIGSLRNTRVLHTFNEDIGKFAKNHPDLRIVGIFIEHRMFGERGGIPVVVQVCTEKK